MEQEPLIAKPVSGPRPGWVLISATTISVLISGAIWSRNSFLSSGNAAAAIAGAFAPLIWAIVTALLFSISLRFRNARAKTTVVMWATVVFILGGMGQMTDSWNRACVRGINATCPRMLDAATRMDRATAGPGRLITLHETALAMDGASMDRVAWRKTYAPALRAGAIRADFVRRTLASGTSVAYRYTGRDGVFIDEIRLTPADLQQE